MVSWQSFIGRYILNQLKTQKTRITLGLYTFYKAEIVPDSHQNTHLV